MRPCGQSLHFALLHLYTILANYMAKKR
jgi:hypothetical protein